MQLQPTTLEGKVVRLEPLERRHEKGLIEVGMSPDLWKWTANIVDTTADLERYIATALAEAATGASIPFATVLSAENRVVGSTRFANIDVKNRKVEIGWTWVGTPWQRSAVNTEAKLLMLTHAFEVWECIRVELKTDARNEKSRNAMKRIGCTEEGTLRNHMITESGYFRDTVYFSIIESEWPAVKVYLEQRLRG